MMPSLSTYQQKHLIAWLLPPLAVFALVFFGLSPAQGESTAAISQGFKTTDASLVTGALVSMTAGSQNSVELSNTERANRLIGILGDNPLIELGNNDKEARVVTSGTTQALVSDINGDVKTGDRITPSPINGVGMRATASSMSVGTAQADLASVTATTKVVNDKNGQPQSVKIGGIPIQISVAYYIAPENENAFMPPFLQSTANYIADKDVSPVRILVSMIILTFGFASIVILMYSSIRSSIISIGRNPLSESAVRKGLLQVCAMAIGILLVMLVAIYLVLTT
jgi:hypothetical protein